MQLKCSQTQKHSKGISKTVHVTSVAQLQFCKATRILFVCKENTYFFSSSAGNEEQEGLEAAKKIRGELNQGKGKLIQIKLNVFEGPGGFKWSVV